MTTSTMSDSTKKLAVEVSVEFRQGLRMYALERGETMGEIVERLMLKDPELADCVRRATERRDSTDSRPGKRK